MVNAIKQQGDRILNPVSEPTGVDIQSLKALEDSSDMLTKAADQVSKLQQFKEKQRLERELE